MIEPPIDPRIERARALYVDSEIPVRDIARRVGVASSTIDNWVRRFGWPRRSSQPSYRGPKPKPPSRSPPRADQDGNTLSPKTSQARRRTNRSKRRPTIGTLVDRLYRIITHNLEIMESRMTGDDHSPADNPERDARAIGNIVRSVEKLKELEPDQSKRDARATGKYPLTAAEEDKLRDEIVERLLKLRERIRNSPAG